MERARIVLLTGLATLALGIAALAVGITLAVTSGGSGGATKVAQVSGGDEVAQLLDGVRQHGIELGAEDAPATLVEFADLQCRFCAAWSTYAFPELVRDYVRTGKVKLVFRGLAFLGADSERALRTALAASLQNRLWNVVDLLYRNQGAENSGWVTDQLLEEVGRSVDGLDVATMLAGRGSTPVQVGITDANRDADAAKVTGTPTFFVGRTGSTLERFAPPTLDAAAFRPKLDALLNGR